MSDVGNADQSPAVVTDVVAEGTIVPAAATENIVAEAAAKLADAAPLEEEKKPETQEDQRFAQKFAALSRKEKQIRDRERQMQAQMAEYQKKLEQLEAERKEVEKYKEMPKRLKQNAFEVFKEAGMNEEDVIKLLANNGKMTPEMERAELEARMEARLAELQKKLEEKDQREQEEKLNSTLNAFVSELTDFVNNTPDYELIRAENGIELVYQVIEQHYARTLEETGEGEVLSNKAAADLVEEYYLNQAKKMVDREKVKKLLTPPPAPVAAPKGKPTPTLSNTQASVVPSQTKPNLSKEESLKQAAALIRWED